jgi:hypothetical protein
MKLAYSPHLLRSYTKAPLAIQRAFDKQAFLLPIIISIVS